MTPSEPQNALTLTTRQVLAVKPQAVFKLLTDFPAYGAWAPFLTLAPAGKHAEAGQLDFRIRVGKLPIPISMAGEIVTQQPPRLIAWRMGGYGIRLLETFRLDPVPQGARVIHTVQCVGGLKGVLGESLLRTYGGVMRQLDVALARRLTKPRKIHR
ncbi:SRPBCC family protein [Caulobacter hibisci]|uniref:SRPBCC family protein n=1 Tax=Caulobacter hibisci TaxID=2035993 RepID=A0ABS0SVI1_9CAUL|nr:SRPBCC family protein [Caulobacter hibisci]MBI1683621.1 SRPBCC family protein [Caulobacter hibisci]